MRLFLQLVQNLFTMLFLYLTLQIKFRDMVSFRHFNLNRYLFKYLCKYRSYSSKINGMKRNVLAIQYS